MHSEKQKDEIIYQFQQKYLQFIRKRGQNQLEQYISPVRSRPKLPKASKAQSFHDQAHTNTHSQSLFDHYLKMRRLKREQRDSSTEFNQLSSSYKSVQLKKILIGDPNPRHNSIVGGVHYRLTEKPSMPVLDTQARQRQPIIRRTPQRRTITNLNRTTKVVSNKTSIWHKQDSSQQRESISRTNLNGWFVDQEEDNLF